MVARISSKTTRNGMTQKEQVIEALVRNGGFATFSELNRLVDVSSWTTKTPAATIRRIVQQDASVFYRIMPGQWGLVAERARIERAGATSRSDVYTHSYYQGLLVEIGNARHYATFIPAQDKNHLCSANRRLKDVASMSEIYNFTSEKILRKARTVDTIWFNCREMPRAFFEVEHTTSIQNSLDKFFELQDFNAKFRIVSDASNQARFDDLMSYSRYREIRDNVLFYPYEKLVRLHTSALVAQADDI